MKHILNTVFFIAVFVVLIIASFYYTISWWLFPLPFVGWFIISAVGSGLVQSNYHIKTFCSNPDINSKQVAISFDDGPHHETLKVLDLLKKYNAKATFFCIGSQIEKHPEIFKQMVSEGHTFGNHTYSHSPRFGLFSTDKIVDELTRTNKLIKENS
ncbi:MAG: polysaccharide deacetylase family protein, partial [Sphingobacteriales bacterium]